MRAFSSQKAVAVRLEAIAVDHNWPGGLLLVCRVVGVLVGRIRIADDQRQPLAVGRPGDLGDSALDVGDLDGLTAGAMEEPHLTGLCSHSRGEKGQVLVVRAPPW